YCAEDPHPAPSSKPPGDTAELRSGTSPASHRLPWREPPCFSSSLEQELRPAGYSFPQSGFHSAHICSWRHSNPPHTPRPAQSPVQTGQTLLQSVPWCCRTWRRSVPAPAAHRLPSCVPNLLTVLLWSVSLSGHGPSPGSFFPVPEQMHRCRLPLH